MEIQRFKYKSRSNIKDSEITIRDKDATMGPKEIEKQIPKEIVKLV